MFRRHEKRSLVDARPVFLQDIYVVRMFFPVLESCGIFFLADHISRCNAVVPTAGSGFFFSREKPPQLTLSLGGKKKVSRCGGGRSYGIMDEPNLTNPGIRKPPRPHPIDR